MQPSERPASRVIGDRSAAAGERACLAGPSRAAAARPAAVPRGARRRCLLQARHPPDLAPGGRGLRTRGRRRVAAAVGSEPRFRPASARRPGVAGALPADLAQPRDAPLGLLHGVRPRPRALLRPGVPRARAPLGPFGSRRDDRGRGLGPVRSLPVARRPVAPLRERQLPARRAAGRRPGRRAPPRARRARARAGSRPADTRRLGRLLRAHARDAGSVDCPGTRGLAAAPRRPAPRCRRSCRTAGRRGAQRGSVGRRARRSRALRPQRAARRGEDVLVDAPRLARRDTAGRCADAPAARTGGERRAVREP